MPSRARLASLGLTEWYELGNAVVRTNDIANANITPNKLFGVLTSNVIENGNTTVGNVYFTNARAVAALTGGQGIDIFANGLITTNTEAGFSFLVLNVGTVNANTVNSTNWGNLFTSNVVESGNTTTGNVFFTNTRAIGALTAGQNITIEANGLIVADTGGFTGDTDDVPEGSANLYFTDARAIAAFTPGENLALDPNGLISVASSPTFEDLTIDGNLTVSGNITYLYVENLEIEDNMFYLNANSNIANPDLGWVGNYNDGEYAHAGIFRDASDGVFKFFDGYLPEPDASPYIDTSNTSFHLANVQATTFFGNLEGNVANLTTDLVAEGASFYFTNARAIGSLTAGDGITIEANGLIVGAGTYTDADAIAAVKDNITTDNVIEGSNLYYTNTRVRAYILDVIQTGDITESGNTDTGNVYFTNNRAVSAFTGGTGITILANGLISASGEASSFTGTTDDIAEGTSNLYYTNARVDAFIAANITTSNIAEGSNLYFSNDRSIGALTAGSGITIESNGLIVSNPVVTVLNATEQFSGDGVTNTFTMSSTVTNEEDIIVTLNGVVQIPTTDYTVNGTSLIFVDDPVEQSNIEVRSFGTAPSAVIPTLGNETYFLFYTETLAGGFSGSILEGQPLKGKTATANPNIEANISVTSGFTRNLITFNGSYYNSTNVLNRASITLQRRIEDGSWTNVAKHTMPGRPAADFIPATLISIDTHGANVGDTVSYRLINTTFADGYVASEEYITVQYAYAGDTFTIKEIR